MIAPGKEPRAVERPQIRDFFDDFWKSQGAIINTIFKIAGYTYGPILGLYLTGLFTKLRLKQRWVPLACMVSALLTYVMNEFFVRVLDFDFGFMNILVNALLTVFFLFLIKSNKNGNRTELSN